MKYIIKYLALRDNNKNKCYLKGVFNRQSYVVLKKDATRFNLEHAEKILEKLKESGCVLHNVPFIVEIKE